MKKRIGVSNLRPILESPIQKIQVVTVGVHESPETGPAGLVISSEEHVAQIAITSMIQGQYTNLATIAQNYDVQA